MAGDTAHREIFECECHSREHMVVVGANRMGVRVARMLQRRHGKGRELLVALQLEANFSKRDLLLTYLNRVYLGVGWGFEAASRHYFAKPAPKKG